MSQRRRPFGSSQRVLANRTLRRLLAAAGLGALVGWVLVRGEIALGVEPPGVVRFSPESSRSLLSSLLGGLITLAGFTFWVRSIVVQLVSTQISPRVLSTFLEDRFQEKLLAFMAGAVVFTATVLVALPEEEGAGGGDSLAISVLAVLVVGLTALTGLLYSMRSGIRTMQVGELIRRIAERGAAQLDAAGAPRPEGPLPSRPPDGRLRASDTGWLGLVDYEALEAHIPDGTVVALDVEPGEFVTQGSPMGRIWTSTGEEPRLDAVLAPFLALTRTRDEVERYSSQVDWLVDIAERAISPTAVESATVHEVAAHLGWLLERAVVTDSSKKAEPEGNLLLPGWATNEGVTRDAFRRLARNEHPSVLESLTKVLGKVLGRLPEEGPSMEAIRRVKDEIREAAQASNGGGSASDAEPRTGREPPRKA